MKDNHGFYKALKVLAEDIFACFLHTDYEDNLYLYEHRIHNSKIKFLSLALKYATHPGRMRLQALYNGLVDGGLLRWRVKDQSTFAICSKEMTGIRDALMACLSSNEGLGALSQAISEFESIYQSVLQVTAKELLPFLLFIQSLKTLEETLCEP